VRQWGAGPAMEVARIAAELRSPDIAAYGIGGDELGLPTADLRPVYEYVASQACIASFMPEKSAALSRYAKLSKSWAPSGLATESE